MARYRLLKFDVVHPMSYLHSKQEAWDDLNELSQEEYRTRLNRLRSNYSDYYTYHLDDEVWEAEEYYLLDPVYTRKVARELHGMQRWGRRLITNLKTRIRPSAGEWSTQVVEDYIRAYEPDVLFPRSQPLPSSFWQQFRDDCLLVARLSARMPKNWHPEHFDVLYTDHPVFRDFFELHDVPTYINDQGFDERILSEVEDNGRPRDVTFVGGLGTHNFSRRTELLERVAAEIPSFKWWGYWWPSWDDSQPTEDFPNLQRTFQGPTSGVEMFQIYRDSKVVLNDYVDTADGLGVNQRMYEVLGVGAFMLTREAPNFDEDFPTRPFETFENAGECLDKIQYFLEHGTERQQIAEEGQEYVLKHFNYSDIIREFDHTLRRHLEGKH